MSTSPEIDLTVAAGFEELELIDVLMELTADWAEMGSEESDNLALAVREAAANAIRHGSPGGAEQHVRIQARLDPECLTVVVRDQGPGFDPDELPDPLAPPNLLKTSGRGIFLMRSFMDDVLFEFPEAGGTVVTMRKSLVTRESASAAQSP